VYQLSICTATTQPLDRSAEQVKPPAYKKSVSAAQPTHFRTMFSPFGSIEKSENLPAAWHPEPQFRGTYGILSSCLITLGLCIWTAVHLNLPEQSKAKAQVWRKTKWLFIALLAPEIVSI
jgi:hypothetical protein